MAYTLKTNIANKDNYGNKRSLSSIKYIVIHYTANDGDTDEGNGEYFKNRIVSASAHYFVDDDSVTQSVPDDYIAWSVGGNKYSDCDTTGGGRLYKKATNSNTLSIEICDDVKNGVVYPSQKTIENAIDLTLKKMKEYNISKENVIRHFDVNGKKCPAYWVNDAKWKSEFWNKLNYTSSAPVVAPTTSVTPPFLIKVDKVDKGDVLNIRKAPNASSAIMSRLQYNDPNSYTIIETKDGWGLLKSRLGWINLYYTKIVTKTATPAQEPVVTAPVKKSNTELAKEVWSGLWGNGTERRNRLTAAGYDYNAVQAEVNRLYGKNTSVVTTPAKKSINEIAKEVINGDWGNGTERKNRLISAGYDYNAVQSEVNRLCAKNASVAISPTAPKAPEKSLTAWAEEVINGNYGNGHANREAALKKAGCTYSYAQVRAKVNELLR